MFNESFYPTPASVAKKMLARLTGARLREANILEPSAGKGDLAEAIMEAMKAGLGYGNHRSLNPDRIRCVEIHPELQATLRGKGFSLVGTDFLNFHPDEKYNLIVMNPPFADGDKHLLHAWEILEHGDVLACSMSEPLPTRPRPTESCWPGSSPNTGMWSRWARASPKRSAKPVCASASCI